MTVNAIKLAKLKEAYPSIKEEDLGAAQRRAAELQEMTKLRKAYPMLISTVTTMVSLKKDLDKMKATPYYQVSAYFTDGGKKRTPILARPCPK